ncbi:uncharacterized protein CLUP02_09747 [Colletotrichum lupini]|uniref:Uncharacterized protein n=1 Tax=Colletotrichum lupini TaxID=145971 RepID=A0A9Q8SWY8_9PEZI|nr:uncharacterized protein CLUP02_09747 [Colletotrichum lupini]UQC84251.1 hypothetical protein CLUP02_09747 [Colletotrichum lupini]
MTLIGQPYQKWYRDATGTLLECNPHHVANQALTRPPCYQYGPVFDENAVHHMAATNMASTDAKEYGLWIRHHASSVDAAWAWEDVVKDREVTPASKK